MDEAKERENKDCHDEGFRSSSSSAEEDEVCK